MSQVRETLSDIDVVENDELVKDKKEITFDDVRIIYCFFHHFLYPGKLNNI